MTLTSLSERKLHPFFSFQRWNCFQKDGSEPPVVRLRLFIKASNERERIFVQGAKLVSERQQVQSRNQASSEGQRLGRVREGQADPVAVRRGPRFAKVAVLVTIYGGGGGQDAGHGHSTTLSFDFESCSWWREGAVARGEQKCPFYHSCL